MENVICAKFHFEVKYNHIIDFDKVARTALAPFLKLATGFNILNQGDVQEIIKFIFSDSKFTVEFRWDRAFLLSEGDLTSFEDEQGPASTFFRMLNALERLPSFTSYKNAVSLVYFITISDKSSQELVKEFKKEYLSPNVDTLVSDIKDIALVLEKNNYNPLDYENITIGPYFSDRDKEAHELFPLNTPELAEFRAPDTIGRMIKVHLASPISNNNELPKKFKSLLSKSKKHKDILK